MAIKEKLKQQRQHIEDLDKHMYVPESLGQNWQDKILTIRSDDVIKESEASGQGEQK